MPEKNEKKSVAVSLENHARLEEVAKRDRRTISATLDIVLERALGGGAMSAKPFNAGKLTMTPVMVSPEDYPSEANEREAVNEKD